MSDDNQNKIQAARKKAAELKEYAQDYIEAKKEIPTGRKMSDEIAARKKRVMKVLNATAQDWADWNWQMANRIRTAETLDKILDLNDEVRRDIEEVGEKYRWAFSPYYATLMDPNDPQCAMRIQMVPQIQEMEEVGVPDFSGEEYTSPVNALTRWYPDRVIIRSTNICSSFCRHCLRRRHIGVSDAPTAQEDIDEALDYIRDNPEIRDVLYTGGDPLTFDDDYIDWLLSELDAIDHVEIKRIGSRMPFTVPQRITAELCNMLEKHHPLYINVQVNHPMEVTDEAAEACDKLTRAGISLGNQTVLLKGVNDDPDIMKLLNHELLKIRVRPYYIYHCQGTIGIEHLRTPVETGIEILENLRGYTSGMAVPDYIITPAGLGKTPLAPEYQISSGDGFLILRNWEGKAYRYDNPG